MNNGMGSTRNDKFQIESYIFFSLASNKIRLNVRGGKEQRKKKLSDVNRVRNRTNAALHKTKDTRWMALLVRMGERCNKKRENYR